MSQPDRSNLSIFTKRLLTALPFIVLAGCATPTTVSEQTGPLDQRLIALESKLDAGLQQSLATAEAARQHAADAQRLAAAVQSQLDAQLNALRNDQATHQTAIDSQIKSMADQAAQHTRQLNALQDVLAQQSGVSQDTLEKIRQDQASTQAAAQAALQAQTNSLVDARLNTFEQGLANRMSALEARMAEVARMAEDALAAMGLGPRKIFGKVVRSSTLTDDKTLFPINSPELGKADIEKLEAIAAYVKTLDVNYHIAIHGHTDGLGSDDYNYALGKARAEVVKNYLHEKSRIPLLRMSVISHGATNVTAYREGANRRIVVEVLQ